MCHFVYVYLLFNAKEESLSLCCSAKCQYELVALVLGKRLEGIKCFISDGQVVVNVNDKGHGVHFRRAGPRDKVNFQYFALSLTRFNHFWLIHLSV